MQSKKVVDVKILIKKQHEKFNKNDSKVRKHCKCILNQAQIY